MFKTVLFWCFNVVQNIFCLYKRTLTYQVKFLLVLLCFCCNRCYYQLFDSKLTTIFSQGIRQVIFCSAGSTQQAVQKGSSSTMQSERLVMLDDALLPFEKNALQYGND